MNSACYRAAPWTEPALRLSLAWTFACSSGNAPFAPSRSRVPWTVSIECPTVSWSLSSTRSLCRGTSQVSAWLRTLRTHARIVKALRLPQSWCFRSGWDLTSSRFQVRCWRRRPFGTWGREVSPGWTVPVSWLWSPWPSSGSWQRPGRCPASSCPSVKQSRFLPRVSCAETGCCEDRSIARNTWPYPWNRT